MKNYCYNHPDRISINECEACHKPICDTCNLSYYRRRKIGNVRVSTKLKFCPQCYLQHVKFRISPVQLIIPIGFFVLISAIPFYIHFTSDSSGSIIGPLLFAGFGLLLIIIIMVVFINSKKTIQKTAELRVKGILDGTIQ